MSKAFRNGEIIFNEGDVGDTCFDVISGTVGIFTDYGSDVEKKLTEIHEGHIFGELALIDSFPRSATAVALTDVVVREFNLEDLENYFKEEPEKVTFIIKEMSDRISRLTGDYN